MLADLLKECQSSFLGRVDVSKIYCWTNSEIALCWIKGKEKCWKPWVENRIEKIRKVVEREQWFHVKGNENPADFQTHPFEIFSELWKNGPEFLLRHPIECKSFNVENESLANDVKKEEKKSSVEAITLSSIVEKETSFSLFNLIKITHYSSLKRLIIQ